MLLPVSGRVVSRLTRTLLQVTRSVLAGAVRRPGCALGHAHGRRSDQERGRCQGDNLRMHLKVLPQHPPAPQRAPHAPCSTPVGVSKCAESLRAADQQARCRSRPRHDHRAEEQVRGLEGERRRRARSALLSEASPRSLFLRRCHAGGLSRRDRLGQPDLRHVTADHVARDARMRVALDGAIGGMMNCANHVPVAVVPLCHCGRGSDEQDEHQQHSVSHDR